MGASNLARKIPPGITNLESFIRWAASPSFPEHGRFSYLHGALWENSGPEPLFSHGCLVTEIAAVLWRLASDHASGYVFTAGAMIRNVAADLATQPDTSFVSFDSLERGTVRLTAVDSDHPNLIDGSPDLLVEVVSDRSEQRDFGILMDLYWRAVVAEYWLVDARGGTVRFDIYRRGARGYTATQRAAGGWLHSIVFGQTFRITRAIDPLGNLQFTLEVKS